MTDPPQAVRLWLGKPCIVVAWLGLFLALVARPDGIGISVCWLEATTGLPCPGCGLTRSLSCAVRGLFTESWHYHPMGLPILGLFMLTALYSLLPRAWRQALVRALAGHAQGLRWVYWMFVACFVGFGVARALYHAVVAGLTAG